MFEELFGGGTSPTSGGRSGAMVQQGSYVTAALGWVQERPGEWKRYLIRVGRDRKPIVTPLIWVDPECPVCIGCLSQRVDLEGGPPYYLRCFDCNALSEVDADDVLDDDDDDEEGEDEYGSDFQL